MARGHWASENKLHWQLDLTFLEDKQRHRTDKAPENLALIRKIVLNTIQIKEKKWRGMKNTVCKCSKVSLQHSAFSLI